MKVLQINAVYGTGSTGNIVRDISDKLIAQGHESYVMWASLCRGKNTKANLIRIGNTLDHKIHAFLRRIDGGQGRHSRVATILACKQIEKISPDVVHLHNLHSNYLHLPTLLRFLARKNIPTLLTLHDCWFLTGHCMHYIKHNCDKWTTDCSNCHAVSKHLQMNVKNRFAENKKLFANIDHLSVNGVSRWTADAARKSILSSAENIEYIYNWINTDVFYPYTETQAVRKKYGISSDKKIILGVSQAWDMSDAKGIEDFIEISKRFYDTAEVILVGKNNGIPETENLKCIGFTANTDELAQIYSLADVLINASRAETFGLVTVEAMACGTPVVAYDNTGSSELITKECGILVEDGNREALIGAVDEVLKNGKNSFSSACREYAIKNFEKNIQTQKYIDLYKKISADTHTPADKE